MILAGIDTVTFVEDHRRHTVYYTENCRRLNQAAYRDGFGTFGHVLAVNEEQAALLLSVQLRDRLASCAWGDVDANDFVFTIRTQEQREDGTIWIPCSVCTRGAFSAKTGERVHW